MYALALLPRRPFFILFPECGKVYHTLRMIWKTLPYTLACWVNNINDLLILRQCIGRCLCWILEYNLFRKAFCYTFRVPVFLLRIFWRTKNIRFRKEGNKFCFGKEMSFVNFYCNLDLVKINFWPPTGSVRKTEHKFWCQGNYLARPLM